MEYGESGLSVIKGKLNQFVKTTLMCGLVFGLINCGGTESELPDPEPTGGLKVYVPESIRQNKLPSNGTVRPYIAVDSGRWQEMTVVGGQARVTLQNITVGTHTFEIKFEFVSSDYPSPILIFTATETASIGGSSPPITFVEEDYRSDYDEDNDDRTNLEELENNLNPLVSNLPKGQAVDISTAIPNEITDAQLEGTLRATISIDGEPERAMQISNNTATISVADLTIENHDFKIRFYLDSETWGNDIPLGEIDQSAMIESSDDFPNFTGAILDSSNDSDNDGQSNFDEIIAGSNPFTLPDPQTPTPGPNTPAPGPVTPVPGPETPTPNPIQFSVEITSTPGSTIVVGDVVNVALAFSPAVSNQGAHQYQWQRNGAAISDAIQNQYTISAEDIGSIITVHVTPIDADGELITSAQISNALQVNDIPEAVSVSIADANSGAPEIGDWLVGQYVYSDSDGDIEGATNIRWLREETANNFVEIGSEANYQISAEDSGLSLYFEVTPVAATGETQGLPTRSAAILVTDNEPPVASNVRIVDSEENAVSNAAVGSELSIRFDYSDAEGNAQNTEATQYFWLRDDQIIEDEEGNPYQENTYIVSVEDLERTVFARVIPAALEGNLTGSETTSESGVIIENSAPSINPSSIVLEDLNGAPLWVGDRLLAHHEFFDIDGDQEGVTLYQWLRNGEPITDAHINSTQSTYTLDALDADENISVRITPVSASGVTTGEAVTSGFVTVGNLAPEAINVSIAPSQGDVYVVGENLSASYTFTDEDGDLEGQSIYRWYRNNILVLEGSGAELLSYSTGQIDSGATIRFEVIPVAATGTENGVATAAISVSINAFPQVENVTITDNNSGNYVVGTLLTANYLITDAEEPSATSASIQWVRLANSQQEQDVTVSLDADYELTSADSGHEMILQITPTASTGSSPGIAYISGRLLVENSAPFVTNVTIVDNDNQIFEIGDTLHVNYTYNDIDGDVEDPASTLIQWFRDDTPDGAQEPVFTQVGTGDEIIVSEAENGKALTVRVTPAAATGFPLIGAAEEASAIIETNSAPSVSDVQISIVEPGILGEGSALVAQYTFSDIDGDPEGNSIHRWRVNGTISELSREPTYILSEFDPDAEYVFEVTPVSASGLAVGEAVESSPLLTDKQPIPFEIDDGTEAPRATQIISGFFVVQGINVATPISVENGRYSINNGGFTSQPGIVLEGQEVRVELTSSSELNTMETALLTIGSFTAPFDVTTIAVRDATPNHFEFEPVENASVGSPQQSEIVQINGINDPVSISITNGQYRIIGETDFTSASGTVLNGQQIQVRGSAPNGLARTTEVVLDLEGFQRTFSISTENRSDTLPEWINAEASKGLYQTIALDPDRSGIEIADFDGDGDLDVMDGVTRWFENNGSSNPEFTEHDIDNSEGVWFIDSGDLNNDDHIDVVAFTSDRIFWMNNNGADTPSFIDRLVTLETLNQYSRIHLAYVNNDPYLDIVLYDQSEQMLLWYENSGTSIPNFDRRHIVFDGNEPGASLMSIQTAYIDSDEHLDIVVTWNPNNTSEVFVRWFENSGGNAPTFDVHEVATVGSGSPGIEPEDFNGDGHVDLLVGSGGYLNIYLNNGQTIPSFSEYRVDQIRMGYQGAEATDIDHDGDVDFVIAERTYKTLSWYENNGETIPSFTRHMVYDQLDVKENVTIADLNNDGELEFVELGAIAITAFTPVDQHLYVLESTQIAHTEDAQDEDGNPLTYQIAGGEDASHFTINPSTGEVLFSAPSYEAPSDDNGDNIYRVWLSVSDGFNTLHRNLAFTVFNNDSDDDNDGVDDVDDALPLNPNEQRDDDADGIGNNADADDDADGVADEQDASPTSIGNSAFPIWISASEDYQTTIVGSDANNFYQTEPVDMDGDSDIDILVHSLVGRTISWYENDGDPIGSSFTENIIDSGAQYIKHVSPGDFNADNKIDFAAAFDFADTISWFENDGSFDPIFTEVEVTGSADRVQMVRSVDLNDDGFLDMLAPSTDSRTLAWYRNNGASTPSFEEFVISSDISRGLVTTGDINGDGDIDVITRIDGIEKLAWFENTGGLSPSFEMHLVNVRSAYGFWSLEVCDIDGDSDLDIVLAGDANNSDKYLVLLENQGGDNPVFTEQILYSDIHYSSGIKVVDIDKDGDYDVLVTGNSQEQTAWLENDGQNPVSFKAHGKRSVVSGSTIRIRDTADMNLDGHIDILSTSSNSQEIQWHSIVDARYQFTENSSNLFTEDATDLDGQSLVYAIAGGDDADHFGIDPSNGVISFNAPNTQNPQDLNLDNVYGVVISVTDGFVTLHRSIEVEVLASP